MKILKIIFIVVISLVIIAAALFFSVSYFKPKQGGINIDTTPGASVYINGGFAGGTPFKKTLEPGQVTLRLEPEATASGKLLPYETKVNIASGIETVVRREFAQTEELSSGYVISFEKKGGKNASLIVITTPDNAQVSLDRIPRGFTPYKTSSISPAKHEVGIKAPGYRDRMLVVSTLAGFQMTVFSKLGIDLESRGEEISGPKPTPSVKTFIEILTTPTGFLRVRTEPGTSGEEIAEVKPGEKYLFLEEDPSTGWYKIQYRDSRVGLPEGIVGWVSNQYSKKIETIEGATSSPSAEFQQN